MAINIKIKTLVDNLSLSDIFEVLKVYALRKNKDEENIVDFEGFKFKIEVEIDGYINYTITEIK